MAEKYLLKKGGCVYFKHPNTFLKMNEIDLQYFVESKKNHRKGETNPIKQHKKKIKIILVFKRHISYRFPYFKAYTRLFRKKNALNFDIKKN